VKLEIVTFSNIVVTRLGRSLNINSLFKLITIMANILDVILKTVKEVQTSNKKDKNVPTADKSVFDLLKDQLKNLDKKVQKKQAQNGKRNPKSVLDMIKDGIEGVRKDNRKNPAVETADKSIFDQIMKKVEAPQQRQAASGLKRIVQDYNLDVSQVPKDILQQVQAKNQADRKKFDHQYAQALFDVIKKTRR